MGRFGLRSPLARRLVVTLVMVSSILALLLTAVQLYGDFRHEIDSIEQELDQIEKSFGEALRRSVWTLDDRQITTQLEGILVLPHIESVYIAVDGEPRWARSRDPASPPHEGESRHIAHRFDLTTRYKGRERHIGTVVIVASLDSVYQHLFGKALFILLGNAFKTLVVVAVLFAVFQIAVTRRLDALARYARELELDGQAPPSPPPVAASGREPDEIDLLARRLGEMARRLGEAYGTLSRLNEALQAESERHRQACRQLAALSGKLEEQVRQRTRALRATNQELESFVYAVSHDLRAPLRAINGFAHILEEDYAARLDDEGRDYLRRIQKGAARMGQLIEDLLRLSRINQKPLQPRWVDLTALARDVARQLRQGEPERQVEFEIEEGVEAWGDPGLLRIVLENLLGNAWKYSATRPTAHIRFGTREEEGQRCFVVEDDGVGFDMARADRLFAPFQRLHDSGEFEGEGIGLATVARILNRHGGRIWAEGRPDQGARFFFLLPGPEDQSLSSPLQ